MPKPLAGNLGMHAALQHMRCVGVTQIVEANADSAVPLMACRHSWVRTTGRIMRCCRFLLYPGGIRSALASSDVKQRCAGLRHRHLATRSITGDVPCGTVSRGAFFRLPLFSLGGRRCRRGACDCGPATFPFRCLLGNPSPSSGSPCAAKSADGRGGNSFVDVPASPDQHG